MKREQIDRILNSRGVDNISFTSYAGTKHSYGNAYKKGKSDTEIRQQKLRNMYSQHNLYRADNDKFDFGIRSDMDKKKARFKRLEEQQNLIKTGLTMGIAVVGLFAIVQLVFKVY